MSEPIEKYLHEDDGYHPFIIREGWQVARLNFMKAQHRTAICRMEKHRQTDEVFWLLKGRAMLIAARQNKGGLLFECTPMQEGIIYNIPKGTWHNIAMEPQAAVMIVEKSHTHVTDCVYRNLNKQELQALHTQMDHVIF